MARTNKTGIDYFSFDVDFFQDEKVQFVSARFGTKGEAIVVRLLCKIYRNGYYTEWNDDTALLFAKSVGDGCQDSFVKDVVYELLKRGFFNKDIFERFSVLTSKGIQSRYFEATKRYKNIDVDSNFLLVNVSKMINVNIIPINADIIPINADINSQREKEREKEIKTNKEKNKRKIFYPPSLSDVENYCSERKNRISPKQFVDYYTSNGWVVGKSKMKDWKAAVRTWENRDKQQKGGNYGTYQQSPDKAERDAEFSKHIERKLGYSS